jgi:hypothetical protein
VNTVGTLSTSPDGRFRLERVSREYRNNEWLESDSIFDCERGREIIAMPPNHSLAVEWHDDGRFAVTVMAEWLPDEPLAILVDVPADTITLAGEEEAQPLPRFEKAAFNWLRARRKEREQRAMGTQDAVVTSPDGRIRIEYQSSEMRMSLWVEVPHVIDVASGRTIFKPESSLVSAHHEWGESGQFTLDLREYPDGAFWVRLHFDIDAGTVRDDDEEEPRPIGQAARIAAKRFAARRREVPTSTFYHYAPEPTPFRDLFTTFWGRVRLAIIVLLLLFAVAVVMEWVPAARWFNALDEAVRQRTGG